MGLLLASTLTTFARTTMFGGRLSTVPIQNATLAGGVSIGATANLVGPFGAVVVGSLAGALSTYGFIKSPFFGDVDTCGISNLHGMPGILGGVFSALVPCFYPDAGVNATNQVIGLVGTLLVAGVTGAGTGFVMKALGTPDDSFSDETFWKCADDVAKK